MISIPGHRSDDQAGDPKMDFAFFPPVRTRVALISQWKYDVLMPVPSRVFLVPSFGEPLSHVVPKVCGDIGFYQRYDQGQEFHGQTRPG